MRPILCLLALFCLDSIPAQPTVSLTVGDLVPTAVLQTIEKDTYNAHSWVDRPGKLLILDFFSTACGSCINALPQLDELQQAFGDSLRVIVSTAEPRAVIAHFLATNPRVTNNRLGFLTSDTILSQYFPHYLIPHEVWIKDHKVIAITEAEAVTAKHIRMALSGRTFSLPVKTDRLGFNPARPLRNQLEPRDSLLLLQQDLFTSYIAGLQTRRGIQKTDNTKRLYFTNWEILNLFQYVWHFQANRIVLETRNPAVYLDKQTDPETWKKNNLFCYEGVFPASSPDSISLQMLRQTLQTASPLQGSWQKRNLPCYVLKTLNEGPPPSKHTRMVFRRGSQTDSIYLIAHSMKAVTAILNDATQPIPGRAIILDETGILYPVDLVLPAAALSDPVLLQKALAPLGIALVPAHRDLDVFVLTDNPSFHSTQTNKP